MTSINKTIYFFIISLASFRSLASEELSSAAKEDIKQHPENYFLVGPSSVPGESGFGLYLRKDLPNGLKSLPANFTLPFSYPGKRQNHENFEKLLSRLAAITQKYDKEKNESLCSLKVKKDLKYLKDNFGITIRTANQNPTTKIWSDENLDLNHTMIDWDHLYDQLVAYVYEVNNNGKREHLYLTEYSHFGDTIFKYDDVNNFALSINEPPPKNFINLYTLDQQNNAVSVIAVDNNTGSLQFKTLREIQAGEELFLSYGPGYTKIREDSGYSINLSRENGAGMFQIVKSYLIEMDEDHYKNLPHLHDYLGRIAKRDIKAFHSYFDAIANYRHDPTTGIRDLDQNTLLWLSQIWDPDFLNHYLPMKTELAERQEQITNYWVRFVNNELLLDDNPNERKRIFDLMEN